MRTHMDVQEGYRPWRPTVKASGAVQAAGQFGGPPEAGPVERYAPGMGYPGDEGGGPPDSRLDTPAGRGGRQREGARSGSHRRPVGDSRPGTVEYLAAPAARNHGPRGGPGTTGPAAGPGYPAAAAGTAGYPSSSPRPGSGHATGGGDVIGPATLSTAAPPSGLPRPRSQAPPRRARTPGAARTDARVRRSRGDPRARPPAPRRLPADRCGAPGPSALQGRADTAQSADSRPRPEHPTRCTRRASSRPGTHPRSATSAPQGGPGPRPDPAQTRPGPSTRCWR